MSRFMKLAAACAGVCLISPVAFGQVLINEFVYDDEGTDDIEFVELFNAGAVAVDISGWTVFGRDTGGIGPTTTIPAATNLAPGAYYVVGNAAVPNVNQVVAINFFENDNETIEIRDSAGGLIDAVLYEAALGVAFAPADVLPHIGRGVWGNQGTQQGISAAVDATFQSWSRLRNGVDSNNNGRDFLMRTWTPGASNTQGSLITQYTPPDVDALSPGTVVSGLNGSFRNPRVINPGDTTTLVNGLALNPNAIPPSPQGGNAIIAWDPSGGGNTSTSQDYFDGNGFFDIFVYLDTSDITVPGAESTSYGLMGSQDTFHNFPDPDANLLGDVRTSAGHTGLAWIFNKNNAGNNKKLFLVDAKDGGDSSPGALTPNDWSIITTIDMSTFPSAWYRMSIQYDSATGAVTAIFDGQVFNFDTATGLAGEFYTGYRESLAGIPTTLRPPTFDIIPEPSTLGLLAMAGTLALRRKRQ